MLLPARLRTEVDGFFRLVQTSLKGHDARTFHPRAEDMKSTLIAGEPVSAYDAKTHLSKLLERTAMGERFVITRHGKPVAQLIPFEPGDPASVRLAMDKVGSIRARLSRKGVTLAGALEAGESVRDLSHAGHRY